MSKHSWEISVSWWASWVPNGWSGWSIDNWWTRLLPVWWAWVGLLRLLWPGWWVDRLLPVRKVWSVWTVVNHWRVWWWNRLLPSTIRWNNLGKRVKNVHLASWVFDRKSRSTYLGGSWTSGNWGTWGHPGCCGCCGCCGGWFGHNWADVTAIKTVKQTSFNILNWFLVEYYNRWTVCLYLYQSELNVISLTTQKLVNMLHLTAEHTQFLANVKKPLQKFINHFGTSL